MREILNEICEYFKYKEKNFVVFTENDVRIEGWFKGELLMLFKEMKDNNRIKNFDREVSRFSDGKRFQVDFSITTNDDVERFIEIKSLSIGQKKKTPRNLSFYFRDDNLGVINDLKKFKQLKNCQEKYIMLFVYPNPKIDKWQKMIKKLKEFEELKELKLDIITDINDFNDNYYIAFMKVQFENKGER